MQVFLPLEFSYSHYYSLSGNLEDYQLDGQPLVVQF